MLTDDDLKKITVILDDRLDKKLDEKLDQKLDEKLSPLKKDIRSIKKTLDTAIRYFDRVATNHEKRIKRVEHHLTLPPVID